jgi:hypothetical protein
MPTVGTARFTFFLTVNLSSIVLIISCQLVAPVAKRRNDLSKRLAAAMDAAAATKDGNVVRVRGVLRLGLAFPQSQSRHVGFVARVGHPP